MESKDLTQVRADDPLTAALTDLVYPVRSGAEGGGLVSDIVALVPSGFLDVNDQTGTTYTFVAGDLIECVIAFNGSASTYSIPDSLGSAGDTLNVYNKGAGTVTIDMAGTDTLNTADNDCAQYKAVTCLKIASTVWAVIGGS